MAASNNRSKEFDTVHHLMSRIAHRVYFLNDDERNDFVEMMRRSAEFAGIRLLGWCVMANHFHILAHLPAPGELLESEIIRRIGVLKGDAAAQAFEARLVAFRSEGERGAQQAEKLLDCQRRRMYDLGSFMKILKQWFTEEYNRRNSHVGTLWESAYHDRVVTYKESDISRTLAYINLNPVNAAICTGFGEYAWSSLNAAMRGDALAIQGLQFVYGESMPLADILARHHQIMGDLLKAEKFKRAREIVRKRAVGYDVPADPLTDEAFLAQYAAHYKKVLDAGVSVAENENAYRKCSEKREMIESQIVAILKENAFATASGIAKTIDVPMPTVYKYLKDMVARGVLSRSKRTEPWSICEFYI